MKPEDLKIDIIHEKPKSGMWHCGPNACWITILHIPTMISVRLYSGRDSQHVTRAKAMELLELAIDGVPDCLIPYLP